MSVNVSSEKAKEIKTKAYSDGYDNVPNSKPSALGLGASLRKCWDSGREDADTGKDRSPRCGSQTIAGRRRKSRKTKKQLKKSKKTRKH